MEFEYIAHKLSFITYILGGYLVESNEDSIEVNGLEVVIWFFLYIWVF